MKYVCYSSICLLCLHASAEHAEDQSLHSFAAPSYIQEDGKLFQAMGSCSVIRPREKKPEPQQSISPLTSESTLPLAQPAPSVHSENLQNPLKDPIPSRKLLKEEKEFGTIEEFFKAKCLSCHEDREDIRPSRRLFDAKGEPQPHAVSRISEILRKEKMGPEMTQIIEKVYAGLNEAEKEKIKHWAEEHRVKKPKQPTPPSSSKPGTPIETTLESIEEAEKEQKIQKKDAISTAELKKRFDQKSPPKILLDIGEQRESSGAIQNSTYVGELFQQKNGKWQLLPQSDTRLKAALKGKDLNDEIIIYCGCCPGFSCGPSARAFWYLQEILGYKNVKYVRFENNLDTDWIDNPDTQKYSIPAKSN